MGSHLGQQAVVIGGSLAGLMAARVLADHFDTVTVLERDHIDDGPTLHQSIPQGSHLHALLFGGQQVMAALYPGFVGKLETLGAVRCRAGMEVAFYLPPGKAFSMTGTVREPRDLGFDITCHSRGLLEYCVRDCTLQHANIAFVGKSTAQKLMYADGRVRGVHYTQAGAAHCLSADLVVDAGGRRSQAPHWLTALGYPAPEITTIGVDVGYASTKFRVPEAYDEPERLLGFIGPPPDFSHGALLEIIEQRTWHVTLMGRFGSYPPPDATGFLAFAKALHTPNARFCLSGDARGTAGGSGRARAVFRRRGCPHGRRSRGPTAGDRGAESGQAAFGLTRGTVAESCRGAQKTPLGVPPCPSPRHGLQGRKKWCMFSLHGLHCETTHAGLAHECCTTIPHVAAEP